MHCIDPERVRASGSLKQVSNAMLSFRAICCYPIVTAEVSIMNLTDRRNDASVLALFQDYHDVKKFYFVAFNQVINQILTFILGKTENINFWLMVLILVAWSVPSISGLICVRKAFAKS